MTMQGAQLEFQDGTVIFNQGDPGGDLYFIKEGSVEVFRVDNGLEVSLATLVVGEVLGIMTCLTREPRLASARAKGAVRAVVVKQAGIKTLISSTPPWVNSVIKDFILRIKQMNDLYTHAMVQMEKQQRDASLLELATFYAGGLAELGAMLTPIGSEDKVVDIEVAQKRLARVLGVGEDALERVFQVFVEVGLLKMDPRATARRAELPVLERLSAFAAFARALQSSDELRRGFERLDTKDCAILMQLCERARAKLGKVHDEVKLELSEVTLAELPVVKSAAEKAAAVHLLRFDPPGGGKVVFTANKLSQSLRCLAAVHKLRAMTPPRIEKGSVQIITENF